jgi:predicted Zn-dependent protease
LSLALQQRPGDPTLTLDYGQLLIAQGKEKEGLAQMRAAIRYADQLGISFPRREEAVAALAEAN